MTLIPGVRLEAASVARQLRARWRASLILSALLWVAVFGWWLPAGLVLLMALLYDRTRRAMFREFGRYQHEAGQLAALIVVYALAARALGGSAGLAATTLLAGAPFAHTGTRARLLRRYWLEGRRREWRDACAWHGLYRPGTRQQHERPAPRLLSAHRTPVGLSLRVRCSAGWTAADVERAAPGIASWYRARNVQVAPDARDVATLTVLIQDRDPLAAMAGTPWPQLGQARTSMWSPIPVAVSGDGGVVTLSLPEKNLLLAGEPGAGKSVAQSMLVATAALDPDATLFVLDGKELDLVAWEPVCEGFAGASLRDALAILDAAATWERAARARLKAEGKRKIAEGDPLCVVVVDELAYYANEGKDGKAFIAKLRDLTQRGRAAGVIVIAATQKPGSDVIPTSFRDLVAYRWALRCTTPEASDTSLGKGNAERGYDASTIPSDQRGTGLLLAEGGLPLLCRSYYLSDDEVEDLAARALFLRQNVGKLPIEVSRPTGPLGWGGERVDTEGAPPESPGASPEEPGGNASVPTRPRVSPSKWREPVLAELAADPGRPDREIARKLGCDHKTIAKYRTEAGL